MGGRGAGTRFVSELVIALLLEKQPGDLMPLTLETVKGLECD